MAAPHRIRRLRCSVAAPSRDDAFVLRTKVRRSLEDDVLRMMESVFDEVGIGDDVIEIGRMEVHVRLDRPADVSGRLPELVARQVRQRLAALTGEHPSADGRTPARRLTAAEHAEAMLTAYLHSGALPPSQRGRGAVEVLQSMRETVRRRLPHTMEEWHRTGARPAVLLRLLQLVPEHEWAAVAAAVAAHLPADAFAALTEAISMIGRLPADLVTRHQRLEAALALVFLARGEPDHSARRGITALGSTLAEAKGAGAVGLRLVEVVAWFTALTEGRRAPDPAELRTSEEPETAARPSAGPPAPTAPEPDTLAALVPSAGLILLHPFLPRLFASTGLVSGGALHADQIPRAAALLHWLATDDDEPAEFELPLVKLLLGLMPETPLIVGGGLLSDGDREEVVTLLAAVIEHWAALGRTSVGGLRSSFLRRAGLLRDTEDGWRLQVMSEGFDVLLDHLPWGIGVIRLPWMPRPIFCEWLTP